MSSWPTNRRTTVRDLQNAKKRGEKWAMLTAYDSMISGVFDETGVKVMLVGDSAGMVVYGHETTVAITLEELLPLAGAVVRGTHNALIVGDLPFGSYQLSAEQAFESATRYMKEAGTQAVKLEGGKAVVPQVEKLTGAGIPVMGHLGLTPQSVHALSGLHRVQGRGEAGDQLVRDALALQDAGAFAVVLEAVPASLGAEVTRELKIPTIGIGAGPSTDAQVLVWQDMAGLTPGKLPRFVKKYMDMRAVLTDAATQYVSEVQSGAFPDESTSYE